MNNKTILSDKVKINYRDTGKGDTTLVFVHGSYIDQSYWDQQVQEILKIATQQLRLPPDGVKGKRITRG